MYFGGTGGVGATEGVDGRTFIDLPISGKHKGTKMRGEVVKLRATTETEVVVAIGT